MKVTIFNYDENYAHRFMVDGLEYALRTDCDDGVNLVGAENMEALTELAPPATIEYEGRTLRVLGIGNGRPVFSCEKCPLLESIIIPEGVEEILPYCFDDDDSFELDPDNSNCYKRIILPSTLKSIGKKAFGWGCKDEKWLDGSVTIKAITPPTTEDTGLIHLVRDYGNNTIYIPQGSLESYCKAYNQWSRLKECYVEKEM